MYDVCCDGDEYRIHYYHRVHFVIEYRISTSTIQVARYVCTTVYSTSRDEIEYRIFKNIYKLFCEYFFLCRYNFVC